MSRSWTFGDIFVLRHAGFPFDWLEELGISGEVHAEMVKLFHAERALEMAASAQCAKAGQAIANGFHLDRVPSPPPEASNAWRAHYEAWLAQRARAEGAFQDDRGRLQNRLHTLATNDRVQEAVFLSSPDVFENVWARYVSGPSQSKDGSSRRRTERLVYSYLQRLCGKNETTSFFGPMGYGAIEGDDDAIEMLPAATPARRTFLAYWAVEALASAAATEPALWPTLPIRKNPLFRIDEKAREARCDALDRVEPLSVDQLRVLDAVERSPDAPAIAANLGEGLDWVETVAMSLFVKGVLVRRIWFRSDHCDGLTHLRSAIQSLPSGAARELWLSNLSNIEVLRAEFETAPFPKRRKLLHTMENLFSRLARTAPRRAGGRLYTDRLIVNEEASSPFRIRVGRGAAAHLAATLSPAFELCASYGEQLQREFSRRVAGELERVPSPIPFDLYATVLRGIAPELPPAPQVSTGRQHVFDLAEGLLSASEDGPRFALPDLCLGRDAGGVIHPILSSMHHHLLTAGWLFTFHPEPARVDRVALDWIAANMTCPLVELATGRHNKGYYSFPGPRAAWAAAELAGGGGRYPVFPVSELFVTVEEGRPVLRDDEGRRLVLYLSLADLTLHPPFAALSTAPVVLADLHSDNAHVPRLDLCGATVQRERWDISVADWPSLSGFALFAAMQRTRNRLGLPRFVFARVPSERKPFLVDAQCPFAVELLKHLARHASTVMFEEMLPSPDQLWLRDDQGRRYTFELRVQAQRSPSCPS